MPNKPDPEETKAQLESFYDRRGENAIRDPLELENLPTTLAAPYKHAYNILEQSLPKGAEILDFACGTGLHTKTLAGMGFRLTGVDLSPKSIDAALKYTAHQDNVIQLLVGDQKHNALNRKFDAIFVSGALYYLDESMPNWFAHHLNSNGILIAVETVGDNLILNTYRKLKHKIKGHRDTQTLDHLLSIEDYRTYSEYFETSNMELYGLLAPLCGNLPIFLRSKALHLAEKIDKSLLRLIPTLAFKIVIKLQSPIQSKHL
jgi:SAM-dependent methyltransferase